jgi:threonine dehydratase
LFTPLLKSDIEKAHQLIASYVHRTPVMQSESMNHLYGCSLYFKCENFQKAGAFKSRGAANALFQNLELAHRFGVATHSSGNHAQALSRVAKFSGVKAHIVMPDNSNPLKVAAVKEYGGSITFCQPTLEARESTLKKVIEQTGAIEIHPYDNLHIIAGQATATVELLEQISGLDMIVAPVGGGGLLSGTALACHFFADSVQVIAAEPENASDAHASFISKKFVPSVAPDTIADGLRTSLGEITFPIILDHVANILTVSENEIIDAMKIIWLRLKIIVEPSSAVVFAAVGKYPQFFQNKKVGLIVSGGNADILNLPWNEK